MSPAIGGDTLHVLDQVMGLSHGDLSAVLDSTKRPFQQLTEFNRGSQYIKRVSMGLDDHGIWKDFQETVQTVHVIGRFQNPLPAWAT